MFTYKKLNFFSFILEEYLLNPVLLNKLIDIDKYIDMLELLFN